MTAQIVIHSTRTPVVRKHWSDEAGRPLTSALDADANTGFQPAGQLWERVAEGLIHEDLTRIASAVKARKRAGLKLHVTPFSSRF